MTKLEMLAEAIRKEHVFIQTHNYPDQDALASAWGLQILLADKGITSTICYEGIFEKANTVTLVERCGIPAFHIGKIPMRADDEIILVDGQRGNVNMGDFVGMDIACIDHHPGQESQSYRFQDIRLIGACTTIIAEYFKENGVLLERKVATALLYGLKVDTASMSRGVTEADVDMFVYLYKQADTKLLAELDRHMLRMKDLGAYQRAIASLRISGNFGAANAGQECSEAMIGTLSDFLISLSEIDFCLVYSYRVGGLKLSVRSTEETWDASNIIQRAIGGYGGGGGHATMAAAFIGNLTKEEAQRHAIRIIAVIEGILEEE